MILLDTHTWVWWVDGSGRLSRVHRAVIEAEREAVGISVISCWEIGNLVRLNRLTVQVSAWEWIVDALDHPLIRVIDLTPRIAVDASTLPEPFHRDPADRLLVATARALDCPLVTSDAAILAYPQVRRIGPDDAAHLS